ncbi:shikimate kinase [Pseudolysobacter antarcticus]|uniref:Shikimate kinase n=1 Tax=Pseudolysobacter antarcticus TaxID=2511995 RepID=A0A411HMR1_9GAMM|nr:shikimate kinase [Pseudolysobacter antarcticus]QBB71768.1 shikimate kinase [Pseudolysobacter antarcticus]
MNPAPNLFFIGPMGAGKSTVGQRVARLLNLTFHDLDHVIEHRTGVSVTVVFDVEGEAGFRRRESEALAELATHSGVLVATGGGVVLDAQNRRVLRESGYVVHLEISVEQQLARLEHDRKRPLLAAPDRRARLHQLAAVRTPLYREIADLAVPTELHGSVAHAARRLAAMIEQRWQRQHPEQVA